VSVLARACTPARLSQAPRACACGRKAADFSARQPLAGRARPRDNKPRAPPLHRRPLLPYRSQAGRVGVGGE